MRVLVVATIGMSADPGDEAQFVLHWKIYAPERVSTQGGLSNRHQASEFKDGTGKSKVNIPEYRSANDVRREKTKSKLDAILKRHCIRLTCERQPRNTPSCDRL